MLKIPSLFGQIDIYLIKELYLVQNWEHFFGNLVYSQKEGK